MRRGFTTRQKTILVGIGLLGILLSILLSYYFLLLLVFVIVAYFLMNSENSKGSCEEEGAPESCFTDEEIKDWMNRR
ncbi:MAG: hypothetical protein R6U61_00730 [Thermoplasmata archaeon]